MWYILGGGSIGCLIASKLIGTAKTNVTLLLKQNQGLISQGIRKTKLTLEDQGKLLTDLDVGLESSSNSKDGEGEISRLIVTTKAHDTINAVTQIRNRIKDGAHVFSLQNGMGIGDQLLEMLPRQRLYVGTTTHAAYKKSPFHVVHAGVGNTWFGALNQPNSSGVVIENDDDRVKEDLLKTGLNVIFESEKEIKERLWRKLAINCCINGLTGIFHCRNGSLLSSPQSLILMKEILKEVSIIMKNEGINIPENELEDDVKKVLTLTSKNISSTLQDIIKGNQTEIDYMNGFIVRKSRPNTAPINRLICDLLKIKLDMVQANVFDTSLLSQTQK